MDTLDKFNALTDEEQQQLIAEYASWRVGKPPELRTLLDTIRLADAQAKRDRKASK
jgi:hypothetical protein